MEEKIQNVSVNVNEQQVSEKKTRKPMKKSTRKAIFGYAFISIWIIGFGIFTFYPFLMSVIYSFSTVRFGGGGIEINFIKLDNFISLFTTDLGFSFLESLKDFVIELVIQVPIIIVFSILISILLNRKMKCRGIFRMIFFLPVIIASGPVINELIGGGATGTSFIEEYGVISLISENLPTWLATPLISLFEEIIIVFWFSGVQIIIFLSALQKIDGSVYEAASIDGASPWNAFWKITLPSLKGMIMLNAIYTIITLATFAGNEVLTILTRSMNSTQEYAGYGFASAMAWVYLFVVLLALGIVLLLFKNNEPKKKVVKTNAKHTRKVR